MSRKRLPLILIVLISAPVLCSGQTAATAGETAERPAGPARSIEDLNTRGVVAAPVAISDTLLGDDSDFRRAMFRQGLLFRVNFLPRFSLNLLGPPVPRNQQVYVGERLTWITGLNPIFTADLRQLGLRDAQLNVGFAWRWTTWNPAGPNATALSTLYFYKLWRDRGIEMKAGYLTNDIEFIGMQVGGALATAAQGVYAVLPFQVGMSYFPLTSPSVNVRIPMPKETYWKVGAQRSLDPAGGLATIARNRTGFRFAPHGNDVLLINEFGYRRASAPATRHLWLRAGHMHNRSRYTNRLTNLKEPGNYCMYFLLDYQLSSPDPSKPAQGLYVGGSLMTVPSKFNSYDRYYELRLYQRAPFRSRPDDLLSLVATYRGHSKHVTDRLRALGRTVWRNSRAVTGSYAAHLSKGTYLTVGLGYVRGAAITPRVADSLLFSLNLGFYL